MYQERMFGYYPQVIQSITEFNGIIDGEYPEFDDLDVAKQRVLLDAYLYTMTEDRVRQWEEILEIPPDLDLPLESRRNTVIANILQKTKLNTETIKAIFYTFTGGTVETWIENSVLHFKFGPDSGYAPFKLQNIVREIQKRIPAHLGLSFDEQIHIAEDSELIVTSAITQAENYVITIDTNLKNTVNSELIAAPIVVYNEIFNTEVV